MGCNHDLDKYAKGRHKQDDSLASLQRLFKNGYDKCIWHLNEVHPKFDICDSYSGKIFDIEKLINENRYNAPIFSLSHPNCFHKEVEIYTNQGWKFFKDLDRTEEVATMNQTTLEWEWQKPTDYIDVPYKGELIRFKNARTIDISSTPNHRWFVKKGLFGKSYKNEKNYYYDFVTSENFINEKGERNRNRYLPLKVKYLKESEGNEINIVGLNFTEKEFALFMGYYLSEGHLHRGRNSQPNIIQIAQDEKANLGKYNKIYADLIDCFNKNNLELRKRPHGFSFSHREFYLYLETLGRGSYNKSIPLEIFNFNKENINIFLDAYILGDGHIEISKNLPGQLTETVKKHIYTVSPKISDGLTELILKAGYSVSYRKKDCKDTSFVNKKTNKVIRYNYDIYEISLKTSDFVQNFEVLKEEYDDRVYCVTVPNSTILVRSNNKVMWSGNCMCYLQCYSSNNDKQHVFISWVGSSEEGRTIDKSNPVERKQDFLNLYQDYRTKFDAVKMNPYLTGTFGDPDIGIYSFDIQINPNVYDINNQREIEDEILAIILNQADKYHVKVDRANPSGNHFIVQTDKPLNIYDFTQEELRKVDLRFKKRRMTLEQVIADLDNLEDWLVFTQDEIHKRLIELETEYQGIANPWKDTQSGLKKQAGRSQEGFGKAWWVEPNGTIHETGDKHHMEWAIINTDIEFDNPVEYIQYLLAGGWLRIGDNDGEFYVNVHNDYLIQYLDRIKELILALNTTQERILIITEPIIRGYHFTLNELYEEDNLGTILKRSIKKLTKQAGIWIDPNNNVINLGTKSHWDWALDKGLLSEKFNANTPIRNISDEEAKSLDDNYNNLFTQGWIRISDDFVSGKNYVGSGKGDLGITCTPNRLNQVENWLIENYAIVKDQKTVTITDANSENAYMYKFTPQEFIESGMYLSKLKKTAGKQVGTLYHFTSIENLIEILQSNQMLPTIVGDKGDRTVESYVSFTRNKNMMTINLERGLGGLGAMIVIDGDKLSNNYKIAPYSQYGDVAREKDAEDKRNGKPYEPSENIPLHKHPEWDESEERVPGVINNISNYIEGIVLDEDTMEDSDFSILETVNELAESKGIWVDYQKILIN